MNNSDRDKSLQDIFERVLELDQSNDLENLTYRSIPNWDSVGHMALVAEIEDVFQVELSTQQVLDLSSFNKANEIVDLLLQGDR
jgi:acyl carrier protein